MNPVAEVRQHLATALAGVGVAVGTEYAAIPTPPQIVLTFDGLAPSAWGVADGQTVSMRVLCVQALAGGAGAVSALDQLVWDALAALHAAVGVAVGEVGPYTADPDTSTLTATIPTQTVWKDT